jgi:hypothetical protein
MISRQVAARAGQLAYIQVRPAAEGHRAAATLLYSMISRQVAARAGQLAYIQARSTAEGHHVAATILVHD